MAVTSTGHRSMVLPRLPVRVRCRSAHDPAAGGGRSGPGTATSASRSSPVLRSDGGRRRHTRPALCGGILRMPTAIPRRFADQQP